MLAITAETVKKEAWIWVADKSHLGLSLLLRLALVTWISAHVLELLGSYMIENVQTIRLFGFKPAQ